MNSTKYMSVKTVASLLEKSAHTITLYIKNGKLRATKLGQSWRVTSNDLNDFIEKSQGDREKSGDGKSIAQTVKNN